LAKKIKSEFEELEKLLQKGLDRRKIRKLEKDATDWYLDKVGIKRKVDKKTKAKPISPTDFIKGKQGIKADPIVGQLFVFYYDAKHKKTLPYWDMFPMTMVIEMYDDGFLGLNIHYLPPVLRMRLMGLIMGTMKAPKLSREAKAKITYQIIKRTASFAIAKPAIKRYLTGHIKSRVIRVKPTEWQNAALLPIDMFQKADRKKVWADTIKALRESK